MVLMLTCAYLLMVRAELSKGCKEGRNWLLYEPCLIVQVYDGSAATSPLSLPGAKARVIELFSFAKSFQLGGFRLGFALGNAEAVAALEAIKAPIDFNQYLGIQRMGIACLSLPKQVVSDYAAVFQGRAVALADALIGIGWDVKRPSACE